MYRAIAAACFAAGLFLALHHPVAPDFLAVAFALWAVAVWRWPLVWLFIVPALLPVLNFLPWTGWVAFEEFDLLLLATAAGGYWRLALHEPHSRLPTLPLGLIALLLASWAIACVRGVADAGGFVFDWFGGYRDSMNSLRIFKSVGFAVLLMPPLLDAFRRDGERAAKTLAAGVTAGLALATLGVLRERATFPGLLDFSTRYRSAGMFWEMHVGGAALDGYLALATPFAAWALLESRHRGRWVAAALLVVLAGYACLTTFSRGMYLAVPFGLAILAWLRLRPDGAAHETGVLSGRARLILAVAFLLVAQVAFHVAGYRGALVLLMAAVMTMLVNALRTRPWWPAGWRTQGGMTVAMMLMIEAVAVVSGGSFLMERMADGNQDFKGRMVHWGYGLAILDRYPDWLFGKGLGRLPARYLQRDLRHEMPADMRFAQEGGNGYVLLSGPPTNKFVAGSFGMGQRVSSVNGGDYKAALDVRAFASTLLNVTLCKNYLIYETKCVGAEVPVKPAEGWQHMEVALTGQELTDGSWYSAQQAVFSLSVLSAGRTVAVDNVSVIVGGRQSLSNGDFSQGLARWFLSGESYFVPWHIDNLALELLIDQGLFGLAALGLLVAAALRRLAFGGAHRHVLAPFIAAALAGYLAVGLFSSLMDIPRVAFLFFLLLITSWLLSDDKTRLS